MLTVPRNMAGVCNIMYAGGAIELTLTGVSSDSYSNSTDCNTTNSSSGEGRHCKQPQPGSWNRLGLALTLPYSVRGNQTGVAQIGSLWHIPHHCIHSTIYLLWFSDQCDGHPVSLQVLGYVALICNTLCTVSCPKRLICTRKIQCDIHPSACITSLPPSPSTHTYRLFMC